MVVVPECASARRLLTVMCERLTVREVLALPRLWRLLAVDAEGRDRSG
jgi:hypothetical protein